MTTLTLVRGERQAPATSGDRRVAVGLLWHSMSSGNLGVGALTESHLALLRSAADRLGIGLDIRLFSSRDERGARCEQLRSELAESGHALTVQPMRLLRGRFAEQARACDLVLDIGEGDSFTTIYGTRRFLYLWLSKWRVERAGTPLVLAPQTIGPFDSAWSRALSRYVMRRCRRVFARDAMSRQYLDRLGVSARAAQAIDVAFALPYALPATRRDHGPGGRIRVGLNVSGLLYAGGYTRNNQFGLSIDYAAAIRRIVGALHARADVELHLVGHVIEPGMPVEDDLGACRELAGRLPGVVVAPPFARPGDAKSYIAGLDFFAGARMHACIAAFSAGVPVIPMAYSRKFNGLFETLDYPALADCRRQDEDTVVATVLAGVDRRDALREQVERAMAGVRARLARYEDELTAALRAAWRERLDGRRRVR
ncbi:MAG: polysaccharide pyruvyl transferase family protein [Burkholderiaceae bacterium]